MDDSLDLHPASPAERVRAFGNFHDAWGGGLSAEDHLSRRLALPKHTNAQWYVGCLRGEVVTACGCYSLQVCLNGHLEQACALGEVHTLPTFRGQGLAARLIPYVNDCQREQGKTLSLLFSDISPAYYERFGYALCTCSEGWTDVSQSEPASDESPLKLSRFDPAVEMPTMDALYTRAHTALPIWVVRSATYWQYLLKRDPQDEFYFADTPQGWRIGYVRISVTADTIKIRDFAFDEVGDNNGRLPFSAQVIPPLTELARARGCRRIGGWMPATAANRKSFQIAARSRELTMLKPLDPRLTLTRQHLLAADSLHEIDHV